MLFNSVLPEFIKRPKHQIVLRGQNATFQCRPSGVPEPTVSWFFSGGHLADHVMNDGDLTLLLTKNNEQYEGNYTCIASNCAGRDEDTAQLTVYGNFNYVTPHSSIYRYWNIKLSAAPVSKLYINYSVSHVVTCRKLRR